MAGNALVPTGQEVTQRIPQEEEVKVTFSSSASQFRSLPKPGITPNKSSRLLTEALKRDLDLDHPIDDDVEVQRRDNAFSRLRDLIATSGPGVMSFLVLGSSKLGINDADGSLDVLCISRNFITREACLAALQNILVNNPEVWAFQAHMGHLSGFEFFFGNVQFNLSIAQVPWQQVPELSDFVDASGFKMDMHAWAQLLDLDSTSCISSALAAQRLLAATNSNVCQTFQLALRTVKLWAQRRGVYGQAFGFPGCTAYATVVARVCQMYPSYDAGQVVSRFFRLSDRWDWQNPVGLLTSAEAASSAQCSGSAPPVVPAPQSPQNPISEDLCTPACASKMVVLDPGAWWQQNLTEHVSTASFMLLKKEFHRAHKTVQAVERGKAAWADVYSTAHILDQHKHYIQVKFLAGSEEVFWKWKSWGKSCIAALLKAFEECSPEVTLRPWPALLPTTHKDWPFAATIVFGLKFKKISSSSKVSDREKGGYDFREPVVHFLETSNQWQDRDIHQDQFEMVLAHVRRRDLQRWVHQELCMLKDPSNSPLAALTLSSPTDDDEEEDQPFLDGDLETTASLPESFERWQSTGESISQPARSWSGGYNQKLPLLQHQQPQPVVGHVVPPRVMQAKHGDSQNL